MQDAKPERLSAPLAENATGWLYQSPESGPRESETLTEGGVASYLNTAEDAAALTLPAWSLHVPVRVAPPVSGPPYEGELQLAIPDPEPGSVPEKETLNGWLYQPFASGPREKEAPFTAGGLASRLTVTLRDASPPVS